MSDEVIIRKVRVDRRRTPEKALKATRRARYTNADVLESIPRGAGSEIEVVLFKLGRLISDDGLEGEFSVRGLIPDPYSLAAVNENDPRLADTCPNGTHWRDSRGRWCSITFDVQGGLRFVRVNRRVHIDHPWDASWWFAGIRK